MAKTLAANRIAERKLRDKHVYMQEMAAGVRATVKAICEELRKESCSSSHAIVLTPNDTNQEGREGVCK
jgi:hypothetical protein